MKTCTLKVSECAASTQPQPAQPVQPVQPAQPTPSACPSNYVYDGLVKGCVCPTNLPFNNGQSCVECNLPQYWDDESKTCLYCPDLKYFNVNSRDCESCPA